MVGIRQIQCNYNDKEESDKWGNAVVIDPDCILESPGSYKNTPTGSSPEVLIRGTEPLPRVGNHAQFVHLHPAMWHTIAVALIPCLEVSCNPSPFFGEGGSSLSHGSLSHSEHSLLCRLVFCNTPEIWSDPLLSSQCYLRRYFQGYSYIFIELLGN